MKPGLCGAIDQLVNEHRHGGRLGLFFDYDGTLTPIVEHPSKARLDCATRRLLGQLGCQERVHLGVISSRTIDDLGQLSRLTDVHLAGAGGMEFEFRGRRVAQPEMARACELAAGLFARLQAQIGTIEGVWIENKGPTLTVHYRDADRQCIPSVEGLACGVLEAWTQEFCVERGPMAIEFRPRFAWNKAVALERIIHDLEIESPGVLFAGDAENDASALEYVRASGGVAIGVGPEAPDVAVYRLAGPAELSALLGVLLDAIGCHGRTARADDEYVAMHGLWSRSFPASF